MAADVGGLIADIGLNVGRLRSDIEKSNKELRRGTNKMNRHLGKMRKEMRSVTRGFKGIAVAITTAFAARQFRKVIDAADNISKLTDRLGGTTEAFSELSFVAERSGLSFQTLTMGLQRMQRRVAEAAVGLGEARGALAELNLDASKLTTLQIDQQFEVIADALAGVESEADRTRLAMKLFDSEGVALLQTMKNGAQGIRDLRDRAKELGVTLDEDAAAAAVKAKDTLTDLNAQFEVFVRNIIIDIVPAVTTAVEKINGLRETLRKLGEIAAGGLGFGAEADELERKIKSLQQQKGAIDEIARVAGEIPEGLRTEYESLTQQIEHYKRLQLEALTRPAGGQGGGDPKSTPAAEAVKEVSNQVDMLEKNLRRFRSQIKGTTSLTGEVTADEIFPISMVADYVEEIDKANEELEEQRKKLGKNKTVAEEYGFVMESAFEKAIVQGEKMRNVLQGIAQDLLRMFVRKNITEKAFGFLDGIFGGGSKKAGSTTGTPPKTQFGGLFANGGSFTVGGQGGTDSQLVSLRATPGERVTVTTPGQSMGGQVTFVYNQNFTGFSETELAKTLPVALEANRRQAVADVLQLRKQGRTR